MINYSGKSVELNTLVTAYNKLCEEYLRHNNAATLGAYRVFMTLKSALLLIDERAKAIDLGWYSKARPLIADELNYVNRLSTFFHKNASQITALEDAPKNQVIVSSEYKTREQLNQEFYAEHRRVSPFMSIILMPVIKAKVTLEDLQEDILAERQARYCDGILQVVQKYDKPITFNRNDFNLINLNKDEEECLRYLEESAHNYKPCSDYNDDELELLAHLNRPKP